MKKRMVRADSLVRKIRSLPPEKAAQVEDFVDFLDQREDRRLTQAAALSARAFDKVWDNPEDAVYDRL